MFFLLRYVIHSYIYIYILSEDPLYMTIAQHLVYSDNLYISIIVMHLFKLYSEISYKYILSIQISLMLNITDVLIKNYCKLINIKD